MLSKLTTAALIKVSGNVIILFDNRNLPKPTFLQREKFLTVSWLFLLGSSGKKILYVFWSLEDQV